MNEVFLVPSRQASPPFLEAEGISATKTEQIWATYASRVYLNKPQILSDRISDKGH